MLSTRVIMGSGLKGVPFSPVNPADIPNLIRWLDAKQIIANDGDAVLSWQDMSGNDKHATQANSAIAPIYQGSYVRFNGVSQFMTMQGWNTMDEATFFIALKPSTIIGNRYIIGNSIIALFSGKPNTYTINPWAWHGATTALPTNKSTILTIRISNTTSSTQIYYDGQLITEIHQLADSFAYGSGSTHYLGKRNGSANSEFQGDVGDFLVYASALTDEEIGDMNNYLMSKWGLV